MIKRLVQMTFQPERTADFVQIFESSKDAIRAFPGCQHLELWNSPDHPTVFFTYSLWESADDLEAYRHSELFKSTWAKTKILFAARPLAYSLQVISEPLVQQ